MVVVQVLVWEPSATPPVTQYAPMYVSWDRIPLHAQYPLRITLEPVAHAQVATAEQQQRQGEAEEAALASVTTVVKVRVTPPLHPTATLLSGSENALLRYTVCFPLSSVTSRPCGVLTHPPTWQCLMVRRWRLIGYFQILTFLIRLSV